MKSEAEEIIFKYIGLQGTLKSMGAYDDVIKCMEEHAKEAMESRAMKGKGFGADFEQNTLTFEMTGEYSIRMTDYLIIEYPPTPNK